MENSAKELSYRERLIYDYKVQCLKNGTSFQESFAEYVHEKDFINKLIYNDELGYIIDNFEEILRGNYSFNDNLFAYLKANLDKISIEDFDRINTTITKCIMESHNHLEEDISDLKTLLICIAAKESSTLLDIKKIDDGAYAKVYCIGDTIIKVGFKIVCKEIPDNGRILIPYFRGMIGSDYIEITDKVITDDNISDEEIYDIYKELREERVIWFDPTPKNLGRLTPKAVEHLNQIRVSNKEHLGIKRNINNIYNELEVGELAIIDLDRIVFEDDKDKIEEVKEVTNDLILNRTDNYEKRYKEENRLMKKIGTR
jgi:hypothetical protein